MGKWMKSERGGRPTEREKKKNAGQSTYPLDWVDNGWTVGSWTMPLDVSLGSAAVAPCHITSNVTHTHTHENVRQEYRIGNTSK